jgi:hypothetical protein
LLSLALPGSIFEFLIIIKTVKNNQNLKISKIEFLG